MTEQIKSAIEGLKFLCECGEIGLTDDEKQPVQLAIRSLQAWEEVLKELETEKNKSFDNDGSNYTGSNYMGLKRAIKIINQHLEIKEVR